MEEEEIKGEALALISLGRPSMVQTSQTPMPKISPQIDSQQPETTTEISSALNSNTKALINLNALLGREWNGATRSATMIKPCTDHEEVGRLVRDDALPTMLKLMILWVLAVRSWMSPRKTVRLRGGNA
ncbi:hypothetical protein F4813DRAFT_358748, partial [Daldinia decipiens]|uniref:uncharacterized protein n=1 Tax=Daldinia decipiens TaxID=326647 RepID=UPI0020C3427C